MVSSLLRPATIFAVLLTFIAFGLVSFSNSAIARSIYLNGIDISNAQSQDIENVSIHINETGDVFIIAPHYQVNEEETFLPLSKLRAKLQGNMGSIHGKPLHKKPSELPVSMPTNGNSELPPIPMPDGTDPQSSSELTPSSSDEAVNGSIASKAGDKTSVN